MEPTTTEKPLWEKRLDKLRARRGGEGEAVILDFYLRDHSPGADWFRVKLFDLIAKADNFNRIKLSQGFPLEVEVFQIWESSPSSAEFFAYAKTLLKGGS